MTKFVNSDSGAVTVDWVVLTGALVGLGLATMGVVSSGVEDLSGDIDTELTDNVIATNFGSMGDQDLLRTYDRALNVAYFANSGTEFDINDVVENVTNNISTMDDTFLSTMRNNIANTLPSNEAKLATLESLADGYIEGVSDPLDLSDGMLWVSGTTEEEQRAFIQGELDKAEGLENYVAYRSAMVDLQTEVIARYDAEIATRP